MKEITSKEQIIIFDIAVENNPNKECLIIKGTLFVGDKKYTLYEYIEKALNIVSLDNYWGVKVVAEEPL